MYDSANISCRFASTLTNNKFLAEMIVTNVRLISLVEFAAITSGITFLSVYLSGTAAYGRLTRRLSSMIDPFTMVWPVRTCRFVQHLIIAILIGNILFVLEPLNFPCLRHPTTLDSPNQFLPRLRGRRSRCRRDALFPYLISRRRDTRSLFVGIT